MDINKLGSIVSSKTPDYNLSDPQIKPDKNGLGILSLRFGLIGILILVAGIALLVLLTKPSIQMLSNKEIVRNVILLWSILFGYFICEVTAIILAIISFWKRKFKKGWEYSVFGLFSGILPVLLILMIIPRFWSVQTNPNVKQMVAKSEMQAMADAEQIAKQDVGYYVILPAIQNDPTEIHYPFAIDTDGTFLTTTTFSFSKWKGPYINYQNICTTGNPNQPSEYGSPLDPWGHAYKFYTAVLTNPAPNESTISSFNKPTLISYGPDGLPGSGGTTQVGTGDDIMH